MLKSTLLASHYSAIVESSVDAIMSKTLDGIVTSWNHSAEMMFGYMAQEMIGQPMFLLIPPGREDEEHQILSRIRNGERIEHFETIRRRKNGETFPVSVTISPIRGGDGAILGASKIVRNISEFKLTHEAQLTRALKYQLLFDSSRDALMTLAPPSWKFTGANPATLELFGSSSEAEFTTLGPWDISPERQPDGSLSSQMAQIAIETALREGSHFFEWEHKRLDGRPFFADVLLTRMQVGRGLFLQATVRDITLNRQAEISARVALSRLEKIASRVPGMVYQFRLRPDGSSCFPYASDAIREIYRVSPEEVREDASKVFGILHPDDLDSVGASIQKSAKDMSLWQHEYRVRYDDGTEYWLFGNAMPELDTDGSVLWNGFITDITERKKTDKSLHMMGLSVDRASDSIFWINREGRILYVNDSACKERGYSRREMLEKYIFDLDPDYQPGIWGPHFEDLKQRGSIKLETRHRTKDGLVYPIEVNANYIQFEMQEFNFCFIRDITERNRINQMKTEFVSTVSHELRTPLTSISGALGLIAGGALGEIPGQAHQMIDVAHRNSIRLTHLINDLLDMEKLVAGKMSFDIQRRKLMPLIEQALAVC